MNYYEPYQRLDNYVYLKGEKTVYVKSAINVLLPAKVSLISKEPIYKSEFEAILEYYYTTDNSAFEPYIFSLERLIKFIEGVSLPDMNMDDKSLAGAVSDVIAKKLQKTGYFTVTCIVYKDKTNVGGQVTNTISQHDEVVIL